MMPQTSWTIGYATQMYSPNNNANEFAMYSITVRSFRVRRKTEPAEVQPELLTTIISFQRQELKNNIYRNLHLCSECMLPGCYPCRPEDRPYCNLLRCSRH